MSRSLILQIDLCWGYEKGCTEERRLFTPQCDEPAKPWCALILSMPVRTVHIKTCISSFLLQRAKDLEAKHELFWHQGDFGYVKDVVDSMLTICEPREKVSWRRTILSPPYLAPYSPSLSPPSSIPLSFTPVFRVTLSCIALPT